MIGNTFLSLVLAVGVVSASPLGDAAYHKSNPEETYVGIYNGNSTTINQHKYMVGIVLNGDFFCSGSILSETWVITVGDCTKGLSVDDLTVVGSSNDGVTGTSYEVLQIVEHPDYGKHKMDYEFSCIQVKGKFYYWADRALTLPTAEPTDNTVMNVAGYGYTSSSDTERAMTEASMTWLPRNTCKSTYKKFDFSWTDRLACAENAADATLCKGDYGDALVVDRVMYGMFTGGATTGFCTSSAKPIIVADVFSVASWIQTVTGAVFTN